MQKSILCILLSITSLWVSAQENENVQVLTAGVEFRPIFPIDFLKTADQLVSNNEFGIKVSPKFSFSAGMVIRYSFHKRLALETGLNFVQRNYNLEIQRDSSAITTKPAYNSKTDFTIIGYEHPIKLLVFVQLSEHIFMNAAGGFQLTFYPSDIFTSDENSSGSDQHFKHSSLRLGFDGKPGNDGFIHGGAIANLGFEYRTKKAGFFYLGGTYHIPFADVYSSKFAYADDTYSSAAQEVRLNGSYLTFDVRYFFHSKPIAPKERKKKKN
ncbi:MAG: PorT family protein [Flavobacteriales bacterium]|nr:PorT family protein [Flavobacteriales bacterium]